MDTRPNILLISTDQQRFDTCGKTKPPFMRTPHIDWLADDGITFTRAYGDCPVCVASRAALMTGSSCFTHGMGINDRTCNYFDEAGTLPTVLREAGYQTAAIGKAHFDPQYKRHGFEEFQPLGDYYREMARSGNPLQPRRHGLGENELYATMATVPEAQTLTSWTAEKAVEYLTCRRDPTKPWFLWVSFSKPHPPLDPPEPYYSMYRGVDTGTPYVGDWARDLDSVPPPGLGKILGRSVDKLDPLIIHEMRAAYYGLITQIDYNIGRIIGAIQDTGTHGDYTIDDNTLILFHSDHGDMLGDHHMYAKGEMWEGSAHVPMIARLPRTWAEADRRRGSSCDAPVCIGDILPTFAAVAGAEQPATSDGIDMIGVAQGKSPRRDYLLCGQGFTKEHPERIAWIGITDGQWKYSWFFTSGQEQLFNIADDPYELYELAGDGAHAEKCRELREKTEELMKKRGHTQYLKDGRLWHNPEYRRPTEDQVRGTGFPGLMTDTHPSDALH